MIRPTHPLPLLRRPPQRGFTLIELIVTLVLFSLMAATLTIFFKPAFDTWIALRTRGDLATEADHAMRRMLQDIRKAVPNSIRTPSTDCFELVPTSSGGRYRVDTDTVNPGAAAVDPAAATTSFDVLSPLNATPAVGDWVVVDNQNAGDVYGGANRTAITSVSTPAATFGRHRLGITAMQFPLGYDGASFTVVPDAQKAVFYVCSGASTTLDANGDAPGLLYRLKNYGFNAGTPGSCPAITGADVVATALRSCRFLYTANQGATQQSGFVSIQLEFTRNREVTSLVFGGHVDNAP